MPQGYIKDLCRLEGVPLLIYQHALLRMQCKYMCVAQLMDENIVFFPFTIKIDKIQKALFSVYFLYSRNEVATFNLTEKFPFHSV